LIAGGRRAMHQMGLQIERLAGQMFTRAMEMELLRA
jgi:hypothetical protein